MSEEEKDKKEEEVHDLKPDKDVKGGGGFKSQTGGTGAPSTQPIGHPSQ